MNLHKIENERLNKEKEVKKEKELEKEANYKQEIEKLKNKIKTMNLEKAYGNGNVEKMETIETHKCKDCNFTSNWKNTMEDHKKNCTKRKKKK